jgi:hypothetical protein
MKIACPEMDIHEIRPASARHSPSCLRIADSAPFAGLEPRSRHDCNLNMLPPRLQRFRERDPPRLRFGLATATAARHPQQVPARQTLRKRAAQPRIRTPRRRGRHSPRPPPIHRRHRTSRQEQRVALNTGNRRNRGHFGNMAHRKCGRLSSGCQGARAAICSRTSAGRRFQTRLGRAGRSARSSGASKHLLECWSGREAVNRVWPKPAHPLVAFNQKKQTFVAAPAAASK